MRRPSVSKQKCCHCSSGVVVVVVVMHRLRTGEMSIHHTNGREKHRHRAATAHLPAMPVRISRMPRASNATDSLAQPSLRPCDAAGTYEGTLLGNGAGRHRSPGLDLLAGAERSGTYLSRPAQV